jgi:hypothetical protein
MWVLRAYGWGDESYGELRLDGFTLHDAETLLGFTPTTPGSTHLERKHLEALADRGLVERYDTGLAKYFLDFDAEFYE